MRDVAVGQVSSASNVLGQAAEAGAENDADRRLALPAVLQILPGFLNLFVEVHRFSGLEEIH